MSFDISSAFWGLLALLKVVSRLAHVAAGEVSKVQAAKGAEHSSGVEWRVQLSKDQRPLEPMACCLVLRMGFSMMAALLSPTVTQLFWQHDVI